MFAPHHNSCSPQHLQYNLSTSFFFDNILENMFASTVPDTILVESEASLMEKKHGLVNNIEHVCIQFVLLYLHCLSHLFILVVCHW